MGEPSDKMTGIIETKGFRDIINGLFGVQQGMLCHSQTLPHDVLLRSNSIVFFEQLEKMLQAGAKHVCQFRIHDLSGQMRTDVRFHPGKTGSNASTPLSRNAAAADHGVQQTIYLQRRIIIRIHHQSLLDQTNLRTDAGNQFSFDHRSMLLQQMAGNTICITASDFHPDHSHGIMRITPVTMRLMCRKKEQLICMNDKELAIKFQISGSGQHAEDMNKTR